MSQRDVPAEHPLSEVFCAAAAGRFPEVDGGVTWCPPLSGGLEAVIAFTGHAFLATRLVEGDFVEVRPDGFGGSLHPAVLLRMAGPGGRVGVIDVTLVARGTRVPGSRRLSIGNDRDDHSRVRHARLLRSDVTVYGDDRGLVTLGQGLAGRLELSIEAELQGQGRGWGRSLLVDALATVPDGEPVFAAVSPGNARSLRAFLAVGFTPIGSECQILTAAAFPATSDFTG